MASERRDNNGSAVDSRPAQADVGEPSARDIPRPATGADPLPAERRSRGELYSDLRDSGAGVDQGPRSSPDGPRTTNEGAWEWKGLRLEPDANRMADEEISARRKAEGRARDSSYGDHGITPAMRRIEATLEHGTLVPDSEKYALKSPDRFKEKLAKLILRYPEHTPKQLSSAIHDGIRYTFILDASKYVDGVSDAQQKLTKEGYELRLLKPSWDDPDYKGVNSRWRDRESGFLFEIQFHTWKSWEAKQATHDIYEKMTDPQAESDQRAQLEAEQRRIAAIITVPKGATAIPYFRAKDAND